MSRRLLVVQGHPDPAGGHFGHALADAYCAAATDAGHVVRRIEVTQLDFPLVRTREDWEDGEPPADIRRAQADVTWCEHLVLFFPLWLGTLPAVLKGFLEQVLRPGFALARDSAERGSSRFLTGRSARVVVTMGMPALVYRWWFRAHGVRGLSRNVLGFCGFSPVRETLLGNVEGSAARRERALRELSRLGRAGR